MNTGNIWFVRPIDCNVKHCIFPKHKLPICATLNVRTHLKSTVYMLISIKIGGCFQCSITSNFDFGITVEPLNKDTFGTSYFVLCREVVLFTEVVFDI